MKFRPCIDIHKGKVKQIVGSTLSNNSQELVENFVAEKSAADFANLYKKDNLTGGHIIMLDGDIKTSKQARLALREYWGGLQIGGGMNPENAMFWLAHGTPHIIVTSYVFKDGKINFKNLDKLVHKIGKDNLVLDLSCGQKDNNYFVMTDKWQKFTNYEVNFKNLKNLSNYCSEFLIHAADVEGKCKGIQEDLVEKLGQWVTIPTTYAGGAKSLSDLDLVNRLGQGKLDLTIGSALDIFGGKLSYEEVVKKSKTYKAKD